jgi:dTDP-4-dehydrorhamnose reductase
MLGRAVTARLSLSHEVIPLTREHVNLSNASSVDHIIAKNAPDVIINCAGVTRHNYLKRGNRDELHTINALFPACLAYKGFQTYIIHISTDCVFGGNYRVGDVKTAFTELDDPRPDDAYGASKLIGETGYAYMKGCLCLRGSFIGEANLPGPPAEKLKHGWFDPTRPCSECGKDRFAFYRTMDFGPMPAWCVNPKCSSYYDLSQGCLPNPEIFKHEGKQLLDWYLTTSQKTVTGYQWNYFTGTTNLALARNIEDCIRLRPEGLYHVPGAKINKFDLLCALERRFQRGIEIIPDNKDHPIHNQSLDCSKYLREIGGRAPDWNELIGEL